MSDALARGAGRALLWQSGYLGGVRVLQLVRFLVLAALLEPQDFGLLAIAWVVMELVIGATDLGLLPSLVQRSEVDRRTYDTAWTLGLCRCALITLGVVAAAPLVAALYGEPRVTPILQGLALLPLLGSLGSVKEAELHRRLQFRSVAVVKLTRPVVEAIVSIALAPRLGVFALVVGAIVAEVVAVAVSYLLAPYRPRLAYDRVRARSLLRFGRWVLLTSLLLYSGEAVLRAVITNVVSTEALGLYFVAVRLSLYPVLTVKEAVQEVGLSLHARLESEPERSARAFRLLLTVAMAVLIPGYAVLFALAEPLVVGVLGPQWAGAVPLVRILSAGAATAAVAVAARPMLEGSGRPHLASAVQGIDQAVLVGLGYALATAFGIVGVGYARLATDIVVLVAWSWAVVRVVPGGLHHLLGRLLCVLVAAAVSGLVASALAGLTGGVLGVVLAAGGGLICGGALLIGMDRLFGFHLLADVLRSSPLAGRRGR